MAIEAKAGFLNRIEQAIAENVTAAAMPQILAKIADLMELYEIRERPQEETTGPDCDMLKAFLDAMRVKGLSKKTLYRYEYVIGKLLKDVQVSCRQITVHHLRDWLAKEQARGLALSTLDGDRQVFSTFFGWLYREGLIERTQEKYRVLISGPATFSALLTSMQMGFKSLALEKRSGEVLRLLSGMKQDFDRFDESIQRMRQRLNQTGSELDTLEARARKVVNAIERVDEN